MSTFGAGGVAVAGTAVGGGGTGVGATRVAVGGTGVGVGVGAQAATTSNPANSVTSTENLQCANMVCPLLCVVVIWNGKGFTDA